MFNKLFLFLIIVLFTGCASTTAKKASLEGYEFETNSSVESVVKAIVMTLSEENVTPTNVNEKYGLVSTGEQQIPGKNVDKWIDVPSLRMGASQKIDIGFTVAQDGKVRIKFCFKSKSAWSGADVCNDYKLDVAGKYFETKIREKL